MNERKSPDPQRNALVIIPTRRGTDRENAAKTKDAHVRIETYKQIGTNIYVDIFDSAIEDPNEAHLVSEMFTWTDEGANEATRFLQKHGFQVAVVLK
jgi:hypothetical protein